jgi:hypothetical protein
MVDISKLVFGCVGKDGSDPELHDAFASGFSVAMNLQAWAKCGAVPLTRNGLLSKKVHHDVVVDADGVIDLEADPTTAKLVALEEHNRACCDALSNMGMDPSLLYLEAPRILKNKLVLGVTRPLSKERILSLMQSKGAGDLFRRTRGEHLATTDMLMAIEMGLREPDIKKKEAEKVKRGELFALDSAARTFILEKEVRTKGINGLLVPELKMLVAWKRGLKTVSLKKEDLKKAWLEESEPEKVQPWSEDEEFELQQLREPPAVGETLLGSEFEKMVNAILNSPELLSTHNIECLEKAIRGRVIQDAETIQAEQTAAAAVRDEEMACRDVEDERDAGTASNATEGGEED